VARRVRSALVLAGLAAALGCSSPRRDAETAIRRYLEVITDAYRRNDPTRVLGVTIPKEEQRIARTIASKRAAGLVLESTLVRFQIEKVEMIGKERMQVRVKERWRYRDRALRPGLAPGKEHLADMTVEYFLYDEEGRWKVTATWVPATQYYDPATEQPIATPEFATDAHTASILADQGLPPSYRTGAGAREGPTMPPGAHGMSAGTPQGAPAGPMPGMPPHAMPSGPMPGMPPHAMPSGPPPGMPPPGGAPPKAGD
jgi:hypothetical protein